MEYVDFCHCITKMEFYALKLFLIYKIHRTYQEPEVFKAQELLRKTFNNCFLDSFLKTGNKKFYIDII